MNESRRLRLKHSPESGQVLVAGIFILIVLLLLVFAGFDIYNSIRAKFKVETAQEAAAIAGASWQRDSLNLIGEINLIKACSVLLTDDENWITPLPVREQYPEISDQAFNSLRIEAIQKRIDVLTEMQSRISFIGPLIGLAAAQQAAKANGIVSIGDLDDYIDQLHHSARYRPEMGGAPEFIYNYAWKTPYTGLIETISRNGIAVYPNAINGTTPRVEPPELAYQSFYDTIYILDSAIKAAGYGAIYPHRNSYGALARLVKGNAWNERFANPPWWDIDYSTNAFPKESEIFSLGVSVTGDTSIFNLEKRPVVLDAAKNHLAPEHLQLIYDTQNGPFVPGSLSLNFFSYDNSWYPDYFRQRYSDYDINHYNYWFKGGTRSSKSRVLRGSVKPQYHYEGPAAYVETAADVGKVTSIVRFTGQRNFNKNTIRIGSNRTGGNITDFSDYRPGTIAKTLGELKDEQPPIALPLVLPVFDKVILMPTYMPIPYNFYVLRPEDRTLRRFLMWLSIQENLENSDGSLPSGCESYLNALRILVQGPQFRYYLWNPLFNENEFDRTWRSKLKEWDEERVKKPDAYQYSLKGSDRTLPGYFQEPAIFVPCVNKRGEVGIVNYKDQINGGTAQRHYIRGGNYMVVDSKGHIVKRGEADPTLDPECCGSCCTFNGEGGGLSHFGSGFSTQKGPVRM